MVKLQRPHLNLNQLIQVVRQYTKVNDLHVRLCTYSVGFCTRLYTSPNTKIFGILNKYKSPKSIEQKRCYSEIKIDMASLKIRIGRKITVMTVIIGIMYNYDTPSLSKSFLLD